MIPQKNQYIKIIFRNLNQAEGFVEQWSEKKAVLRAQDGKSFLIIQDTTADIMAIKLYLESMPEAPVVDSPHFRPKELDDLEKRNFQRINRPPIQKSPFKSVEELIEEETPLDKEFDEVHESKIDAYLKVKRLTELRKLQAQQDIKIINGKLKDS